MPMQDRKRHAAWNRVHRQAANRLRTEHPDRYAELVAEEAEREGLARARPSNSKRSVTPLPATVEEE